MTYNMRLHPLWHPMVLALPMWCSSQRAVSHRPGKAQAAITALKPDRILFLRGPGPKRWLVTVETIGLRWMHLYHSISIL